MTPRLRTAEAVLPGHPDKLADQIADAILDLALREDPDAIVQVEVAVHDVHCHVNGRADVAGVPLGRDVVEAAIRAVYARVGFGRLFPGTDDWQCPRPADVVPHLVLTLDAADPRETAERPFADDQAITIGYACHDERTSFLPVEQHLALRVRAAILALADTRRDLQIGPDGKILVTLQEQSNGCHRLSDVVVSVQHLACAPLVIIERAVRDAVRAVLVAEAAALGPALLVPDQPTIRVNRSGTFVSGGPMNDNGQTGRKLVHDYYGPRVPIGGGALCGKDPWRLDRNGALRARQIAREVVATGFVRECLVTFAWAPRDERPSHVEILADDRVLDAVTTARWLKRFDPSLSATHAELALAKVNWEHCARLGHFGRALPWEGAAGEGLVERGPSAGF